MNENNCSNQKELDCDVTFSEAFQMINKLSTKLKDFKEKEIKNLLPSLSISQIMILRHLWKEGEAPFKIIAKECNCPASTVTGLVDALEDAKLVTRIDHPKDRRSKLVAITQKGKNLEDSVNSIENSINTCCTGFTQSELSNLVYLLKKLHDTLNL